MTSLDPRIARGTARMLALRDQAIAEGAEPIGWKAGFGAPAALAKFEIDRPLVGFLTRDRLLPSGATVSVAGWTNPMFEAEIAAHLSADIGPGATPAEALAAVGGWSVAIELADVSPPPTDLEEILAGNIFHRHVLLGPVVDALPYPLSFSVLKNDEEIAATSDPEALTGELGFVLTSMAATLAVRGAGLAADDVVITGSVVVPIAVENGTTWVAQAKEAGLVTVTLG